MVGLPFFLPGLRRFPFFCFVFFLFVPIGKCLTYTFCLSTIHLKSISGCHCVSCRPLSAMSCLFYLFIFKHQSVSWMRDEVGLRVFSIHVLFSFLCSTLRLAMCGGGIFLHSLIHFWRPFSPSAMENKINKLGIIFVLFLFFFGWIDVLNLCFHFDTVPFEFLPCIFRQWVKDK